MMKRLFTQGLLITLFGSVMFLLSCTDDEGTVAPVSAGFTFSVDTETGGIVTFTNTSENADTYSWDFGDGTNSTDENPVKTYLADDSYSVTLTASDSGSGDEDSDTQTVAITLIVDMTDTEAPTLTLNGDATVTVEIGATYEDAGAMASDNVDGTITDQIEVTGEVNTLQPGEYTLTYNVSDEAGNAAPPVTRTVTVTFDEGLLENGDFEDETNTAWSGEALDIRTEGGNSFAFVNNASAGEPSSVNISNVLPIEIGNTYRLSFNASSDGERTMIAGIGLNEGSFASVSETVNVTATNQRFTYELTASFGSDNSRVLFDMGADVGVLVIDNVSLELVSENSTALPFDFEDGEEVAEAFLGAVFALDVDPEDANNQVGKITNNGGDFEGVTFFLANDLDVGDIDEMSMRLNTAVANISATIKFEATDGASVEVSTTAPSTGWNDLTFDFSAATGTYDKLVVFVDLAGNTTGDFFIDDIEDSTEDGGGGTPGAELTTNGDFETGDATGWMLFDNGGSATIDNTINNGGSFSGKLISTGSVAGGAANPAFKQERIGGGTVAAGDVIQVQFDHNGTVTQPGAAFNVLLFGEGTDAVSFTENMTAGTPITIASSWNTYTATFTIPATADVSGGISVLIEAVCGGVDGCAIDVNIDNVSVKIGSDNGGGDGGGGSGNELLLEDFDDSGDVNKWSKIANATDSDNSTVTYDATEQAILLSVNETDAGAYILRYETSVNYGSNSDITLSFDVKQVTAITGTGPVLHMQSIVSSTDGGTLTTNTFNLEGQINESTFTTFTQNLSNVGGASVFIVDFNFSSGGPIQGAVLIDNITVVPTE